jgi:hypothetical protein
MDGSLAALAAREIMGETRAERLDRALRAILKVPQDIILIEEASEKWERDRKNKPNLLNVNYGESSTPAIDADVVQNQQATCVVTPLSSHRNTLQTITSLFARYASCSYVLVCRLTLPRQMSRRSYFAFSQTPLAHFAITKRTTSNATPELRRLRRRVRGFAQLPDGWFRNSSTPFRN